MADHNDMGIIWFMYQEIMSSLSYKRWDFKSLNPSKPQTRAKIELKSGFVLIRPMRDCSASFLSVADRMPLDQL